MSDDLISRQAAIDALKKIVFTHLFECGEYIGEDTRESSIMNAEKALDVIENLPSAETERKKGKWLFHIDDLFPEESTQECSVCHEEESVKIQNDNFCPNCGADMRGGKNEE